MGVEGFPTIKYGDPANLEACFALYGLLVLELSPPRKRVSSCPLRVPRRRMVRGHLNGKAIQEFSTTKGKSVLKPSKTKAPGREIEIAKRSFHILIC